MHYDCYLLQRSFSQDVANKSGETLQGEKAVRSWAAPSASQLVIPHSSIQPVVPTSLECGLTLTLQWVCSQLCAYLWQFVTQNYPPFCLDRNVVSTVSVGCSLDLKEINFRTRNSEYNPQRFCGVVMRIREPRTTALIFQSGKLVCTGARNEEAACLATRKFARIIQRLGFQVMIELLYNLLFFVVCGL